MLASVLALMLAVAVSGPFTVPLLLTEATNNRPLSSLALRLQFERTAVMRDETGRAISIFGVPASEARFLFMAVDRQRPLPEGYTPPDLVPYGSRLVREMVRPDLQAMVDAAASDGVEVAAISAYRGPSEQSLAFESSVWQAMARANGQLDRAEAEARSSRFVAPPGHSQHQLGTAIDFSTWEINYAVQPRFEQTAAAHWLAANAWQYGFVLSYTRLGEARSGYAFEPWHYRWIGRDLAAVLQRDGYLDHPSLIVDDYLRATEEILTFENIP